jgi:cytochrome c-type biogenesis protein CcmH/NrfF
MRFELDLWDIGALVALALVVIGLAVWHWPAALVALGSAFLWLYVHREIRLAPQPNSQRPGDGLPNGDDR